MSTLEASSRQDVLPGSNADYHAGNRASRVFPGPLGIGATRNRVTQLLPWHCEVDKFTPELVGQLKAYGHVQNVCNRLSWVQGKELRHVIQRHVRAITVIGEPCIKVSARGLAV